MKNQTIQISGNAAVVITWKPDDDPDLSYLDRSADEYYNDLVGQPKRRGGVYTARGARMLANKYAKQDKARLDAYNAGDWYMVGCIATLYIKGIEVGRDSLWGVESDSDDAYLNQIADDMADEVIVNSKANAGKFAEVATVLESLK